MIKKECKGCVYSKVRTGRPLPDRDCYYCGRQDLYLYRGKWQKFKDFWMSVFSDDYRIKDRWTSPKTWKMKYTR